MVFFRLVFGFLLFASVGCFAIYALTSDMLWRRRGLFIVKWTVGVAFAFFAVLIAIRLAGA